VPPAVQEELNRRRREEFERRRTFGNVRPLITTTHQGHRFIAVGRLRGSLHVNGYVRDEASIEFVGQAAP